MGTLAALQFALQVAVMISLQRDPFLFSDLYSKQLVQL
jgi:hypothetical protein